MYVSYSHCCCIWCICTICFFVLLSFLITIPQRLICISTCFVWFTRVPFFSKKPAQSLALLYTGGRFSFWFDRFCPNFERTVYMFGAVICLKFLVLRLKYRSLFSLQFWLIRMYPFFVALPDEMLFYFLFVFACLAIFYFLFVCFFCFLYSHVETYTFFCSIQITYSFDTDTLPAHLLQRLRVYLLFFNFQYFFYRCKRTFVS